jgi:hypothetical protein
VDTSDYASPQAPEDYYLPETARIKDGITEAVEF